MYKCRNFILELALPIHEMDKNSSTEKRQRVLKLQTSKNSSVGLKVM